MKILVIGPSWVGDMVMSQSLYISLKQQYPNAIIDVMAPDWCRPLLSRMPEVNKAIKMPLGHGDFEFFKRRAIGKSLAAENYDWAIIQPNSYKSALIPWFAGIAKRTAWKGESRYGIINDIRTNKKDFPLMVERYDSLAYAKELMSDNKQIPHLPNPVFKINSDDQVQALQKMQLNTERKILALSPGAEFGPTKKWPAGSYAQVADYMITKGWQVWIFGSGKDTAVGDEIISNLSTESKLHCHNLAGTTSLSEAIDLMAYAEKTISNDSGLMHVAAALGNEVIGVYTSTSPLYTPPLTDKATALQADIECSPCFEKKCKFGHLKCLQKITVDMVIDVIDIK